MAFGVVYSKQFYFNGFTTAAGAALFLTPTGYVPIIREIDAFMVSGTAAAVDLYDAAHLGTYLRLPTAVGESSQWTGHLVLMPGFQVVARPDDAAMAHFVLAVSGYLLSGSSPP